MKIFSKSSFEILALVILIGGLALGGCSASQADSDAVSNPVAQPTDSIVEETNNQMSEYKPRLEGKATVQLIVNEQPITIEVDGEQAPVTAGNFVDLVEQGFYDGLVFHRVVKEPQPFVVQGGDPKGNGTGGFVDPETGRERRVPLEIKLQGEEQPNYGTALGRQSGKPSPDVVLPHSRGAVAMARSQSPDSASSQFYVALSELEFLDGDYAVFGYVTQGMDVVDNIEQGDRITSAEVIEGAENLQK